MVEVVIKLEINELIEPSEEEDLDEINKERLLKEWRKTLSCYSLNPKDFKFGFVTFLFFLLKIKKAKAFLRVK
ncbi:MAG: hypothetical protein ACTSP9_08780 [Promethearchaeota archaeon]